MVLVLAKMEHGMVVFSQPCYFLQAACNKKQYLYISLHLSDGVIIFILFKGQRNVKLKMEVLLKRMNLIFFSVILLAVGLLISLFIFRFHGFNMDDVYVRSPCINGLFVIYIFLACEVVYRR